MSCTKVEAAVNLCCLDLLGLGPEGCRLGGFDKCLPPPICKTGLATAPSSEGGYQDRIHAAGDCWPHRSSWWVLEPSLVLKELNCLDQPLFLFVFILGN